MKKGIILCNNRFKRKLNVWVNGYLTLLLSKTILMFNYTLTLQKVCALLLNHENLLEQLIAVGNVEIQNASANIVFTIRQSQGGQGGEDKEVN